MYDAIIVGGGPSALTAAMYLGRKKVKTLVIASDFGGQMTLAANIENYPGIEKIQGEELAMKMKAQAEALEVEIKNQAVDKIEKTDNIFVVTSNDEKFEAKTVLVTSGKSHRKLGVPGEKELTGKGVGYCVTCDGPLFQGKSVAIIGGGNSALDGALELEKYAEKVYIINLNDTFQGDEVRVDKVKNSPKIEVISNAKTTALIGSTVLEKLKYQDTKTNEEKELAVSGCFVDIGWVPSADFAGDLVELNELKEIVVDSVNKTKTDGLYAAGDVTSISQKQIVIAAGEGAKAALELWKYSITNK